MTPDDADNADADNDILFYIQKKDAYTQIVLNHFLGKSFYTNKLMYAFLFFIVSSNNIKEYLNNYIHHIDCISFRKFIQKQLDLCTTNPFDSNNNLLNDVVEEMDLFLKTGRTDRNYQKAEFKQKIDEAYLALIEYTNECPSAAEIEIYNKFSPHKFNYEDKCIRYYHIAYEAEYTHLCVKIQFL
jgi:hypothetical protein